MNMWASFSDSNKTTITGIYSCEQPLDAIPYQDQITESDPRYKAWYDPLVAIGINMGNLPQPSST